MELRELRNVVADFRADLIQGGVNGGGYAGRTSNHGGQNRSQDQRGLEQILTGVLTVELIDNLNETHRVLLFEFFRAKPTSSAGKTRYDLGPEVRQHRTSGE